MQDTNIKCIFPIFENNISKQKIRKLAESIINIGIKAIIVCIDKNLIKILLEEYMI